MAISESSVVTGAFGYTGRYIASRLLAMGQEVRTITGHPDRPDPFGGRVKVFPFHFDNPRELAKSLEGADTLYNTYWVRFARGDVSFDRAVENTKILIRAAREAGIRRVVYVSITSASSASSLPYFRGKGILEEVVAASGLSYAIVRPTVIFGDEDILINNIAWLLRRFPVFPVFGSGQYRIQPVYVEDMADITVRSGQEEGNVVRDAVGPETYTYEELVRLIAAKIHRSVRITHIQPGTALFLARRIESLVGDVVITRDEIEGLMQNLLVSSAPPTGWTRLSAWLEDHAEGLGRAYASELVRHYR